MVRVSRKILFIFCMFCATLASAQDISVSSFKLLENDLTANTTGTMEIDQNGEVSALIKVVTTQQGFSFDGGMVGIVKTKQGVGEIWVYVPHGIGRITIKHPQLGVLRDYYLPIPIEKARTYEMVLTTGTVQTIVNQAINKQYVVFELTPSNALVELDDELLNVGVDGHAEKLMPFGKYSYRISARNHYTEAGVIEVNNPAEKHVVKVDLRPNYGWLEVLDTEISNGADVYIDNERIGRVPMKSSELKSGQYRVKISKSLYKPYEALIEIKDNQVTQIKPVLTPNFANTTLVAAEGTEIYVDGEYKGVGSWTGPLEKGDYTVEVRKEGHRSKSIVVHINTTEERSIQLPTPLPILSAVEITSTPSSATVMMDGKELGTTPLLLPNVLVGKHKITLSKKNYQTITKEIEVKENETAKLHMELSGECRLEVKTNPSGANVSINGEYLGTSPIKLDLYAGEYVFNLSKKGYNSIEEKVNVDGSKELLDFRLKRRYIYPKAIYLDAGVSVLDMGNISGTVGGYINNFNMEFGYSYGLKHSETIYWNGKSDFHERFYTSRITNFKLGYGFVCGNRIRLTPQIGLGMVQLVENKSDNLVLEGANTISATMALRCDYVITSHLAITITPHYMLPLSHTPFAEILRSYSPMISRWSEGIGLRTGVTLFF